MKTMLALKVIMQELLALIIINALQKTEKKESFKTNLKKKKIDIKWLQKVALNT